MRSGACSVDLRWETETKTKTEEKTTNETNKTARIHSLPRLRRAVATESRRKGDRRRENEERTIERR